MPEEPGDTRGRLLDSALRLFSERGFARTSTRALAEAAGANLAAIRYYFGDKAGLYRATFGEMHDIGSPALVPQAGRPLPDMLRAYFGSFVEPLKQGERMQRQIRLHIREMLEPTEQSRAEHERDVAAHALLVAVLQDALGLADADAEADDDLHRLAIAIHGLGMQLLISRDLVETGRPALLASPAALDAWADRLVAFALTLVESERRRRGAPTRPARPSR